MRDYTYIAADFDHDENAVEHLQWMNKYGYVSFLYAHELQQSDDDSLSCSIKKSLSYRMSRSYKFVLVVGSHTKTVTKGGCQLCGSYNSYTRSCARGHTVDYRSFIEFECEKAINDGLRIVVLYNDTWVDRDKCPAAVRWEGTHERMIHRGADGSCYWDNAAIAQAFGG